MPCDLGLGLDPEESSRGLEFFERSLVLDEDLGQVLSLKLLSASSPSSSSGKGAGDEREGSLAGTTEIFGTGSVCRGRKTHSQNGASSCQ